MKKILIVLLVCGLASLGFISVPKENPSKSIIPAKKVAVEIELDNPVVGVKKNIGTGD